MAFSYVKYTGDGANRVFNVPFPYLDRRHVAVKIDGISGQRNFTWLSNGSIRTDDTADAGVTVTIRRNTPNTTPLVDFTDGAALTERDLDLLALQSLFMNQEAVDLSQELADELETMIQEEDEQDAVLLDRIKVRLDNIKGQLTNINARAVEARGDANYAVNVANAAKNKADEASATVTDVGSQVNLDAASAAANAATAITKASEAAASATNAASYAAAADTSEANAAASAASAANSAALAAAAANFNPDDFYTKTQMDGILATQAFAMSQITGLDTALAGKAGTTHTHVIADVSGLQTALDGKLGASATAAAAAKLSVARTITLAGSVTGSVAFDGSANVSITTDVGAGLQNTLDNKVPVGRTVSAGNGLTGGGDLSASRTITLGSPSSISDVTINEVTLTSHTHAVNANLSRNQMAAAAEGSIGTVAFLFRSGNNVEIARGTNYAGTGLLWGGVHTGSTGGFVTGMSPGGTWKALSDVSAVVGQKSGGIFLRIS